MCEILMFDWLLINCVKRCHCSDRGHESKANENTGDTTPLYYNSIHSHEWNSQFIVYSIIFTYKNVNMLRIMYWDYKIATLLLYLYYIYIYITIYEQQSAINRISQQYLTANKLFSWSNLRVKSWREEAEPRQPLRFTDH